MRCFNHPDRDAIGSCKGCCKGLCMECAADLGHGLACKGTHEEMVETYDMIVSKNARVYGSASRNTLIAPVFYAFMGVLFAGYALLSGNGVASFLSLMGLGFLVFAAVVYRANRKTFGGDRDDPEVVKIQQ